jgi:hypothetical protein
MDDDALLDGSIEKLANRNFPLPQVLPKLKYRPLSVMAVFYGIIIACEIPLNGLSGDEFYFIVAGQHLSWDYADAPPLVPLLARISTDLAPGSVVALRLPMIVILPACMLVTALIAREFGGGPRAQVLAAVAFMVSPQVIDFSRTLQNDFIDMATWTVAAWALIRWTRTRNDRLIFAICGVTIVALEDKYLIIIFWLACIVGILLFGPRQIFGRPYTWLAAVIAGLSTVPGLLWQADHNWIDLRMQSAASSAFLDDVTAFGAGILGGRLAYAPALLMGMGVIGASLFIPGLWWLLRKGNEYRFLGCAMTIVLGISWIAALPPHLLADIFPVVWAAGAVLAENSAMPRWLRGIQSPPCIALSAAILILAMIPVNSTWVSKVQGAVLLHRANDWDGLAAAVQRTYESLPRPAQRSAIVIAGDYQRASVLDVLRREYRLPKVFGDMRGFWDFGAPPDDAQYVIYVDAVPAVLREHCGNLSLSSWYLDKEPLGESSVTPIYLCSNITGRLSVIWPKTWSMTELNGVNNCYWQSCRLAMYRLDS